MDGPLTLLALDTSTPRAAVALATAAGAVFVRSPDPAARHGRSLLPAVRDLLASAGLTPRDLDGIVVGLGPGSYTGLRVGVTAAKTLAYALKKPIAGFDSLEAVARNAPPLALRISAISDAQRGDLYAADFARDAHGSPLVRSTETRVVRFDEWAAALSPGTLVLGPAAALERVAAALPPTAELPDDPDAHWPDPTRLASFAREIWDSGRREDVWFLEPVYLRRSSAEEQWERRTSPAGGPS